MWRSGQHEAGNWTASTLIIVQGTNLVLTNKVARHGWWSDTRTKSSIAGDFANAAAAGQVAQRWVRVSSSPEWVHTEGKDAMPRLRDRQ